MTFFIFGLLVLKEFACPLCTALLKLFPTLSGQLSNACQTFRSTPSSFPLLSGPSPHFPVHSSIFPSTFLAPPHISGPLFHLFLYFLCPSPHFRSTLPSFPLLSWPLPTFSGLLFHFPSTLLAPPHIFRSTLPSFILLSWPLPTFSGPLFHLSLYFLGPSPHFPVHSFIFPSILLAPPHIFRSTLTSLTCTYLKYSCVTSCLCQ